MQWAAFGGHAAIVRLLLDRGAPIDVKEERFGGTPLEWALHAWGAPERSDREPYYEVVALLVRAGAKLASGAGEEIQSEPRMIAALKGEF